MKLVKYFAFILIAISCFFSCHNYDSREIETENGSKNVVEIIKEKIGKDVLVSKITMVSDRDLSTHINIINVDEVSDKATVTQHSINLTDTTKQEKTEIENTRKGSGGIKTKNIPENLFAINTQKMIAILPPDMEFASVNSYLQEFGNAKPGKVFAILHAVPKNGGNSKLKNNGVETTYYEFNFSIDENGNTKLLK